MTYLTCSNHRDRRALHLAVYKSESEESRAVYCDECAEKRRALNNPRLTLTRLEDCKLSRTGKPLCSQCRKLATHEGNYHRFRINGGDWQQGKLYYCAEHAAHYKDARSLEREG